MRRVSEFNGVNEAGWIDIGGETNGSIRITTENRPQIPAHNRRRYALSVLAIRGLVLICPICVSISHPAGKLVPAPDSVFRAP